MTTREHLNQHRRRALFPAIAGFILLAAGSFGSNGARFALVIFGFLLLIAATSMFNFGGSCLHCGRRLGNLFANRGPILRISSELHYCPFCSASLDENAPADPPNKALERTNSAE